MRDVNERKQLERACELEGDREEEAGDDSERTRFYTCLSSLMGSSEMMACFLIFECCAASL